jgi:hypothetical protein
LTVVYQINQEYKRLLWVGLERTEETLNSDFRKALSLMTSAG